MPSRARQKVLLVCILPLEVCYQVLNEVHGWSIDRDDDHGSMHVPFIVLLFQILHHVVTALPTFLQSYAHGLARFARHKFALPRGENNYSFARVYPHNCPR